MISSTFVSIYSSKPKIKITRMGKFHHSKKHNGDKRKSSSARPKYDLTQSRRKKLPKVFLYTQNHKRIQEFLQQLPRRRIRRRRSQRDPRWGRSNENQNRSNDSQTQGEVESEEARPPRSGLYPFWKMYPKMYPFLPFPHNRVKVSVHSTD